MGEAILIWLYQRRRPITITLFVGIVLYIAAYYWTNFAIVSLDITSSTQPQSIAAYAVPEQGGAPQKINERLAVVRRGTKTLIAAAGDNAKTQTTIDIPWYGFTSKKIQISPDKNAEKIAFRSTFIETCPAYRPASESLAFYDCNKQNTLVENVNSVSRRWPIQVVNKIESRVKPISPYMGGYISLADKSEGEGSSTIYVRAVNEKGNVISYETPPGLPSEDLTSSRIYTNTHDTTDKKFVIVSNVGDVFIGIPGDGQQIDYKIIAAPTNYDPASNQTQCRFTNDTMYCYRGNWRIGDTPKGFNYADVTASELLMYSFSTNTEDVVKLKTNIPMAEQFDITQKGELFIRDSQFLYHLVKTGSVYDAKLISVYPSLMEAGETLYYIYDKSVYAVDEQDASTARQVFYSPNVVPRSIYAVDGKVFIIASNEKNTQTTYAYKLLNDPNVGTEKRLIDVMPVAPSGNTNFYFSDLVGDQMYFSLNLSRNQTQQERDEDFARKKEATLNYLSSYNVHVDESKITFGS